jgi:DNA-binding NarL/FixJ family response regulator
MKKIRVMLVDDHVIALHSLALFLRTLGNIEVVGQAASGTEAVALCARVRPDVVLMKVAMADMNGVEAAYQIHSFSPQTRILALTSSSEEQLLDAMLQVGAVGFLSKKASIDELTNAIQAAAVRS